MYVYIPFPLHTHTQTHTHTEVHDSCKFFPRLTSKPNLSAVHFLRTKAVWQYITPFFSLYILVFYERPTLQI